MPNEIVRPFKSSVKIDNERNLEMQAEDFTPVCTGDVEAAEFGFKVTGNGSITLDGKRIT